MSDDRIIVKKLDTIIALLATQGQDEDKRIKILKSLGFTYKEISELTGIPDSTLKSRNHAKRSKSKKL